MTRSQMVHKVEITDQGASAKATFYVEHGIIHANIEGKMVALPCIGDDAEGVVRALLTEHIVAQSIRARQNDASQGTIASEPF